MAERKKPRIERKKSATLLVTVRLFGWPGEVRRLSVVDEYWAIELAFACADNVTRTKMVYETDDYQKAYDKYVEYERIVT